MSTTDGVARLVVTADASQVTQAGAAIQTALGQAANATDKLVVAQKAEAAAAAQVATALKAEAAAAKAAGDATRNLGANAEKAKGAAGALAGALALVSPEAAGAVNAAGQLGGVLKVVTMAAEAVGVSMGAVAVVAAGVAVVLAAVATAYIVVSNATMTTKGEADALNLSLIAQGDASKNTEAEVRALATAWKTFTGIQQNAQDALDIINGKIDEQGVKLRDAKAAAAEAMALQRVEDGDRVARAKMAIAAAKELIAANQGGSTAEINAREEAKKSLKLYEDKLKSSNATLKEHKGDLASVNDKLELNAEFVAETALQLEREAAAEKAASAAASAGAKRRAKESKDEAEAATEKADAAKIRSDAEAKVAAARVTASAVVTKAIESGFSTEERLLDAKKKALEEYDTAVLISGEVSLGQAEQRVLLLAELDARISENQAAEMEKRDAAAQAYRAANEAADLASVEARIGAERKLTDAVAALGNVALQAVIDNANTKTKEGKKAARTAWDIQKGLAIATAAIAAAVGFASALADGAKGGPVLAAIQGAAQLALGVAAIVGVAATKPPKFHTGLAPDEYPATLQKGEAVVSRQGVSAVKAANAGMVPAGAGMGGGPSKLEVNFRVRHQDLDQMMYEVLRRGGQFTTALGRK